MTTLTTKDAETIYHIPAETFAQWCREGKLPATKVSGEWRMAITDVEVFLTSNPALRLAAAQQDNRAGTIFSVIATVLGFIVDTFALRDVILGGDRRELWWVAVLVSLVLWVGSIIILRTKVATDQVGGLDHNLVEVPRYPDRSLRLAARILAVAMPVFLLVGIAGYNLWRIIPPARTVVLIADFHDPTGVDSARVTQSLVDGLRETLKKHSDIQIKRLNRLGVFKISYETWHTTGVRR